MFRPDVLLDQVPARCAPEEWATRAARIRAALEIVHAFALDRFDEPYTVPRRHGAGEGGAA